MRRGTVILGAVPLALCGLGAWLLLSARPGGGGAPGGGLLVYCAAGLQRPVTAIARDFEAEHGIPVHLQFGGSGTLLGNLAVGRGDLYLAADSGYIEAARERGLILDELPAAYLEPGLGVAAGNPHGVAALEDLVRRDDLRIGLANPDAAAVGKISRQVLDEHGLWPAVRDRAVVFKPTVNEIANDLALGAIDVGILWDATAGQYPSVDFLPLPAFAAHRRQVAVGVLRSASSPPDAFRLARYLTAADRGLRSFAAEGYDTIEGDRWAWTPELLVFSGAMLRPAVEARLAAFARREGVRVTPVYNGCGILVAQMKAGERPDAYFSCDVSFMRDVADLFGEQTVVSGNDMVILVARGNPRGIAGPADLARPGLRLGFAHPEKSALGTLTVRLLTGMGLYRDIVDSGNLRLDSPTGDFLVNQLRAGSLDAVIVYRSNALAAPGARAETEIVEIDHPQAVAHQPFAVGRGSAYPNLAARLFRELVGAEGREAFTGNGFRWELAEE